MDSLFISTVYNIHVYYIETDQACPEVTRDPNKALVVQSNYRQCQSCKNNSESLQDRLNGKQNLRDNLKYSSRVSQQEHWPPCLKVNTMLSVKVLMIYNLIYCSF